MNPRGGKITKPEEGCATLHSGWRSTSRFVWPALDTSKIPTHNWKCILSCNYLCLRKVEWRQRLRPWFHWDYSKIQFVSGRYNIEAMADAANPETQIKSGQLRKGTGFKSKNRLANSVLWSVSVRLLPGMRRTLTCPKLFRWFDLHGVEMRYYTDSSRSDQKGSFSIKGANVTMKRFSANLSLLLS